MQSFELPVFYVPWPARLNPNLEAARVHSKAWAREMGILGAPQNESTPQIWDEDDFDRHDYALFCSYVHPEAPSPELNLMTDWNVWGFYVDDYFVKVYIEPKSQDYAGAKEYLDRILLFMPVDLSLLPTPTNPTERGLAEVWRRTAATRSEAWRRRIFESTRSLLDACIWELDNMNRQRLANPIEYIAVRRQVGGALWSADLIEHAMSVEIPERIVATRPMNVLKDAFADAVHLRNDIFSYEREVLREGQLTNAVLVLERFLGVDTQRAANLVNDLVTCRLQRFEHIVLTELVPIFQEYALDPVEQANVLTYVRGLQDFQSGAHEWHIQTNRYLKHGAARQRASAGDISLPGLPGLGTAAVRITPSTFQLSMQRFKYYRHMPYKKVGPTRLPQFYMPFSARVNPNLETARLHSKAWARQVGMLDIHPGRPDVAILDERRFDANDQALLCALTYPEASAAQLSLNACWMTWGIYIDDYFRVVYGRARDMAGAKIFVARLSGFMPLEPGAPTPMPLNPVERGLADLWNLTAKTLSAAERGAFREAIESLVGSWLWELSDQIQNRIPDPIDYVEMRRKTFGVDFILSFIHFGKDWQIPPDIYRTRTMQELNKAAGDYIWLANDIVSYQKEIEFEGEIHNAVLVIEKFLDCDRPQAVEIANDLMTARAKQFEHLVATELPLLFEDFHMTAKMREQLQAYIKELQNYMSGSLQWHIRADRYKEFELRRSLRRFSGIPTGLGTAATRILETMTPLDKTSAFSPERLEEAPQSTRTWAISHLQPPFAGKKEEAQGDRSIKSLGKRV